MCGLSWVLLAVDDGKALVDESMEGDVLGMEGRVNLLGLACGGLSCGVVVVG